MTTREMSRSERGRRRGKTVEQSNIVRLVAEARFAEALQPQGKVRGVQGSG
jgi:hypothetical protein